MRVEVEDTRLDVQITQAGFFCCLPQCDGGEIRVAVGMTTRLQPAIQLAVMHQQHALTVR